MNVDATLAGYSDWCFAGAVVVYVLALLLHGAQFAVGRQGGTRRRELVPAGAVEGSARPRVTVVPDGPHANVHPLPGPIEPSTGRTGRWGRMAVALTVLGALVHLASLVLRGLAVERVPWGNMYEFGSAICLAAVVSWLVMVRRHDVARLGVFVLLPIVLLMFVSGTLLYTQAAALTPPLRSYWIVIHVGTIFIASGMLLVAGMASVGYLLRTAHATNPARFAGIAARLPEEGVLDRLAYRVTVAAFPVFTFAIITGAVWAETAWGRYWGWDPKETVALVCWVIYACYLHARATAGWRRGAAWVNVLGFAGVIFNLFFVNLVVTGLHSYAGVG
ncbi:MAG TPA: c-type cytochrome biogenesis protein CcsB [Pseudonocardiaceae bacterium]